MLAVCRPGCDGGDLFVQLILAAVLLILFQMMFIRAVLFWELCFRFSSSEIINIQKMFANFKILTNVD